MIVDAIVRLWCYLEVLGDSLVLTESAKSLVSDQTITLTPAMEMETSGTKAMDSPKFWLNKATIPAIKMVTAAMAT